MGQIFRLERHLVTLFYGSFGFRAAWRCSLQYLSGKLGIATGLSLPEIIREKLKKKKYIIPYWLAAEAAGAATDLAEYLGTVIALNLLFGIPLIYAAIFGALDVLLILTLATQRRFYIIERLFVIFVSIIGFGYLYEIFITKPDPAPILFHSIIPSLANNNSVLLAVGVIGATVMPHALFVHSWLTKNKVENKPLEERRRIRKLHLVENIVLLTIAGMVNAAIMIMAATAFHTHNPGVASISDAYKTLLPLFGADSRYCLFTDPSFLRYCIICSRYACRPGDNGGSFRKEGKSLAKAVCNPVYQCYSHNYSDPARF